MKTSFLLLSLAVAFSTQAQVSPPNGSGAGGSMGNPTDYVITDRGPNHRIWSRVVWETTSSGDQRARTNSYTELATAMHHQVAGRWVESSDQIQINTTGGEAMHSQHQVAFLGNINAPGAVNITLPEGRHLISNVLGLSYLDTVSRESVMIAQIKDANGELLPTGDQALYRDAFSGLSADVLYVNSVQGFEQLIVLQEQPPSPSAWGLDPATTVLQVVTEFLNPPLAQATLLEVDGITDQQLDFGIMKMGRGYAFALGSETNKVRVTKEWAVQPDGRTILFESVPLQDILPLLEALPGSEGGGIGLFTPPGSVLHQLAAQRLPPLPKLVSKSTPGLQLASSGLPSKGLALDYTLITTQTNFLARSDTTYYVSAPVNLWGSNVFEGGTVIKYATNAAIQLTPGLGTPTVTFATSAYRPIVFTAKDDDSQGEQIAGSTGTPTGYYANPAIALVSLGSGPAMSYLRFAYARQAVSLTTINRTISHAQFVNCQQGVIAAAATLNLFDVLFANTCTNLAISGSMTALAENVTFSGSGRLVSSSGNYNSLLLTNCLLANVTNIASGTLTTNGDYNAFYQSPSFGYHVVPSGTSPPFQTVGAGGYYLADNSPYRNAGTTNVDSTLLADLRKKTTYPPVVCSNVAISADLTLAPQAQRDTDAPDLGYHYDPLDYAVSALTVTNHLLLTNGVALATYGTSAAVTLAGSGQLLSQGLANNLNRIVRYNTVQEQSTTNWSSTTNGDAVAFGSATSSAQCTFTAWSILGGTGNHVNQAQDGTASWFAHNQFGGGALTVYPGLVALTNCLWERVVLTLNDAAHNDSWYIYNNLFRGGGISYRIRGTTPVAAAYDNLFDRTSISISGSSSNFTSGYNGYVTNCDKFTGSQGNDRVLTNSPVYLTSYLGSYYYPTNGGMLSTLIDAGSRWATNAGLYHFTTTTNQVKEAGTMVDIGFHYAAIDPNTGQPYDTDGDGLPDYLEDTNGNGVYGAGDLSDWRAYNSPNGLTGNNGLQVFTPLK